MIHRSRFVRPVRWIVTAALAVLTAFWAAPNVQAQVLAPAADAHITDNVTDRIANYYNFGALNYLLVQGDPGRAYKTYLRFDLSPVVAASNGLGVRSATLTVTFARFRVMNDPAINEPNVISVYGITDNDDAWTEGEGARTGVSKPADLNWNNAPHNDKTLAAGLSGAGEANGATARLLGTLTVPPTTPSGAELRLDVTPFVNWALQGGPFGAAPAGDADKVVTFVLVHSKGNAAAPNNGVQLHAKENTAGPMGGSLPTLAPRLSYVIETEAAERKGVISTVVDAETLVVRGVGNVRLAGIAALRDPRRKPRPDDDLFGDEADRACRRLAAGRTVRLEFAAAVPPTGGGSGGGATPAWVFLPDGSLLNEELLRRGYARLTPAGSADPRYGARLRAVEAEARSGKRGLWPRQPGSGGQIKPK